MEKILKRQKARKMLGDTGKIRQEDLRGFLGRRWPRQTKELIGKCSQKPEEESEKEIAVIYGSVQLQLFACIKDYIFSFHCVFLIIFLKNGMTQGQIEAFFIGYEGNPFPFFVADILEI